VIEEKRIAPTVVRRRRVAADPAAPASETPPATPVRQSRRSKVKSNMAAEAREEMEALGRHEVDNPEVAPQDTDEVRDRPNLRKGDIHSPTHPEILGAALERAGMTRPPGHDPHHIVPTSGGGRAGDRARAVIERAGIHGDSADNGVWLPRTTMDPRNIAQPAPIDPRFTPEGLTRHQTIHTGPYYEEVASRLEAAEQSGQSVRDTLRAMQKQIADGKFPF
jgi:A nuclease family of the HNH/ENDO VII superfamily with conserved AHH